jgi:hypothetical protein
MSSPGLNQEAVQQIFIKRQINQFQPSHQVRISHVLRYANSEADSRARLEVSSLSSVISIP